MTSANVSIASIISPDNGYLKATLFDLLTALLDPWSLWNRAAGSEQAGRTWRAEYLRLTCGCGMYVPYEAMVRQVVQNVGLPTSMPAALEADRLQPAPWGGAAQALAQLQPYCKLVVATNCSEWLDQQAVVLLSVTWGVVITAEQVGVYKPDPESYRMAFEQLGVDAVDAAFVVGSSYDMLGTATVDLHTYWYNRIGLTPAEGAQLPEITSSTLDDLLPWARRFTA